MTNDNSITAYSHNLRMNNKDDHTENSKNRTSKIQNYDTLIINYNPQFLQVPTQDEFCFESLNKIT